MNEEIIKEKKKKRKKEKEKKGLNLRHHERQIDEFIEVEGIRVVEVHLRKRKFQPRYDVHFVRTYSQPKNQNNE